MPEHLSTAAAARKQAPRRERSTSPLRAAVPAALATLAQPLTVIAYDVRAGATTIDFVALSRDGRAVGVWLGDVADDAASLLTRALAGRAWLDRHAGDWCQISPTLELDAGLPARALVLCPAFVELNVSAAAAAGIDLAAWRSSPESDAVVLIEGWPMGDGSPVGTQPGVLSAGGDALPSARAVFRSGLSDAELNLDPEERNEFE